MSSDGAFDNVERIGNRDASQVTEVSTPPTGARPSGPDSGAPFWENKVLIAMLGAMASAVVPVQAWISKSADRALEKDKQRHAIEMEYVERSINGGKSAQERKYMLQFLVEAVGPDSLMARWADRVLKEVTEEIRVAQEEQKQKAAEATRIKREETAAQEELRRKAQVVRDLQLKTTKSTEEKEQLSVATRERKAAEEKVVLLNTALTTVEDRLVALQDKLRADPPPRADASPLPLLVRLKQIRTSEDGTLLRTRWSFRVTVNGREAVSVPSELYSDLGGGVRAMHLSGTGLAMADQDIEIRILGTRIHGGSQAEGVAKVPWALIGAGSIPVRVAVPGDPGKGTFEFEMQLQRAPKT